MTPTLEGLLAAWERRPLTPEETSELKALLAQPEARAALVQEWLLGEAIYGALQAAAEQEKAAAAKAATLARESTVAQDEAAVDSAASSRRNQPGSEATGWRRFWPRLVWHHFRIPLRLAFAVALLAGLLVLHAFRSAPLGELAEVRGTVMLERGGRTLAAGLGGRLLPGDVLKVGRAGSARIVWAVEGTGLDLAPETELRLDGRLLGKKFALRSGGLAANVAPQPFGRPLVVRTPHADLTVVGTRFSVAVVTNTTRLEVMQGAVGLRPKAGDMKPVTVGAGELALVKPGIPVGVSAGAGYTLREVVELSAQSAPFTSGRGRVVWNDVITNLAGLGRTAQFTPGATNRYEQRIRAFFVPPVTGEYHLWIDSRNRSELWLSTDQNPTNRRRVATVADSATTAGRPAPRAGAFTWNLVITEVQTQDGVPAEVPVTLSGDFSRQSGQKSARLSLTAGRRYYVEAVHEFTPDDVVIVAWTRVSGSTEAVSGRIEGGMLVPFVGEQGRVASANSRGTSTP